MSEQAPLLRVCSLLNNHDAQYLIIGARACWLHGYVRATMDVDILVPEDRENHARVIAALSELEDHAASELTPQDLIDNIVVKIADEVEVDVSTRAWKVSYAEAIRTSLKTTIEGVRIPYLDLQTLIKSKSSEREQDKVDVQRLRSLGGETS
jgi:hypothetical protein